MQSFKFQYSVPGLICNLKLNTFNSTKCQSEEQSVRSQSVQSWRSPQVKLSHGHSKSVRRFKSKLANLLHLSKTCESRKLCNSRLTFSSLLYLLGPFGRPPGPLLLLLLGPAPVEVLHHHPHKHVEDEKPDQEEEGYEVEQAPLVVIFLGLKVCPVLFTDEAIPLVHNQYVLNFLVSHKKKQFWQSWWVISMGH